MEAGVGCKSEEVVEEAPAAVEEAPAAEEEAPAAEEEAPAAEPVTLTIWWWGEEEAPGLAAWLAESVEMYEAANPNVTVETVEQTGDGLYEAFGAAAAAQEGPDIQYLWGGGYTMGDVFKGNLAPVSDYISPENLDALLATGDVTFKGKVWAVPWYTAAHLFMYNKNIFAEAGLDPENPPETWDDFVLALEAIKDNTDAAPIILGNAEQWAAEGFACVFGVQNSNNRQDLMEVFVDESLDYADPKYSGWWNTIAELRDKGLLNEGVNTLPFFEAFDKFKNGEMGVLDGLVVSLADIVETMGEDNVGIWATAPVYGDGGYNDGAGYMSNNLAITAWANKEEAGKFLDFVLTTERLNAQYLASGSIPPNKNFDLSLLKTEQERQYVEAIVNKPVPYYVGATPLYFNDNALFRIGGDLFGGASVEDIIDQCKTVIEDFRIKQPDQFEKYVEFYEGFAE